MATSNIRREKRKSLQVRPVVAEIVITAVFDIPNNVSEETLINDYIISMSGDFKNVESHLVLLQEDNKHVFLSKKLMAGELKIMETYVS